jgi:hypothetical protein
MEPRRGDLFIEKRFHKRIRAPESLPRKTGERYIVLSKTFYCNLIDFHILYVAPLELVVSSRTMFYRYFTPPELFELI